MWCVGEFNGSRLYAGLRLDYRLRLCAPTSASRAISAAAELLCFYNYAQNVSVSLTQRLIVDVTECCAV